VERISNLDDKQEKIHQLEIKLGEIQTSYDQLNAECDRAYQVYVETGDGTELNIAMDNFKPVQQEHINLTEELEELHRN
jgi:hypothetical protein